MSHVERNDIVDELAKYRWYIWDAVYYNWHKPIPSSFNKDFQQQLEYYYFSFIKDSRWSKRLSSDKQFTKWKYLSPFGLSKK
jgi:hypothetical protein